MFGQVKSGGIFGQVKSVVKKNAFSKQGVAWPYAPMTVWLGGHVKSAVGKIGFSRGVALAYAPMTV